MKHSYLPQVVEVEVLALEHTGAEQAEHRCVVDGIQTQVALAEQVAEHYRALIELSIMKLMVILALLILDREVAAEPEYLGHQRAALVEQAVPELLLFVTN